MYLEHGMLAVEKEVLDDSVEDAVSERERLGMLGWWGSQVFAQS